MIPSHGNENQNRGLILSLIVKIENLNLRIHPESNNSRWICFKKTSDPEQATEIFFKEFSLVGHCE